MEEAYKIAMREHLTQIEEEMNEIEGLASANNLSALAYRAAERNLQLLIEGGFVLGVICRDEARFVLVYTGQY